MDEVTASGFVTAPAPPAQRGGESRAKAWGFTGLLVLLTVVNWADKAVLGVVAQPLAKEFGLSASQIGLVGSAFFLTFAFASLTAGFLTKWLSLRWALGLLAFGWAVSMVPMLLVPAFAVLLLSRLLLGLTEGPAGPLAFTAAYSWHPLERRGLPGAWLAAGASIAKIAVAPVLAVVVVNWGWRAAFLVLAVVGVAWCAVWLLIWRDGPYAQASQSKTAGAASDSAERAGAANPIEVSWVRIFTTPTFIGGALAVTSMYALVAVVLTWLPSYFEVGLGYSRVQAGIMFGFPSIAGLVCMFLSTYLGDRMLVRGARSRVVRGLLPGVALLLSGLTLVTLPYIGVPMVAVVVVSVGYGIGTIVLPIYNAALSQICPPRYLSGALGVFMGIMYIGGLVAPYLTGVIVDSFSDPAAGYAFSFQVFGLVAFVASVIALLTVNPERDAKRVMG